MTTVIFTASVYVTVDEELGDAADAAVGKLMDLQDASDGKLAFLVSDDQNYELELSAVDAVARDS